MKMYPDTSGYIDRGNFMHMNYFLRLLCYLVGVGYREPTGAVPVRPRLLPCLGSVTVAEAPLPGGGCISYNATVQKNEVILADVNVSGDGVMIDLQGAIHS